MVRPKTIQIHLPSGDPKEAKIAEISSELGKLLFCSRKNLEFLKNRNERNNVGIYFLFGNQDSDKQGAYIGEAEKLFDRLKTHLQDKEKEWFSSIVFFTTKDNSLNKALAKYFESYCIEKALEANRYELKNKQSSNKAHISEAEEADIKNSFENLKLLLTTIGFPLFEKLSEGKRMYYFILKGYEAVGEYTNEGFLIKKGSTFEKGFRPSSTESTRKQRDKLITEGIIEFTEKGHRFKEDYLFNSPSTAGNIIAGGSTNGWLAWKTKDGKTMDEVERKK